MNVQERLLKKLRQRTHERITKALKMGPITHLLRENISRVDPARDMEDFQQGILNPFTDRIFPHFHVTNLLSGHIVRPLDTRFVVIIIIKR
jgi:hypothetical protein